MKNSILILILTLNVTISLSQDVALQEAMITSGGYHENSKYSLSWTLGENVVETFDNLTQGFQQNTITNVDGFKYNSNTQIDVTVYPNPTIDRVNVDINDYSEMNGYNVQIFDANGRQVVSKDITSNSTSIDLYSYSTSSYILKVFDKNGNQSKSIRLLKLKFKS